MLTFSFAHEAERYGCEVYEHTPVTNIEEMEGGFIVHSHEKCFKADKVINAAGIFAPMIGQKVGVDIPIKPRKGHILVSSRTELMGTRKIQEFGYLMTKFGRERVADEEMNAYGIALVPRRHSNSPDILLVADQRNHHIRYIEVHYFFFCSSCFKLW